MKTLLLASLILLSGVKTFAQENPDYCQDNSKKVIYVRVDVNAMKETRMRSDGVGTAELVAELSDGTSVIVPCGDGPQDKMLTPAIIIHQSKIFTIVRPSKVQNTEEDLTVVGLNYKTSQILVEQRMLKFIKSYLIQHSDALEKAARK